ncbi:hypothetical protein, partial [Campylobacter avium]|uniref:hypothetical protein n=1 Tax=Campylobacter avium TaxID=522485 RepID=UPI00248BEC55
SDSSSKRLSDSELSEVVGGFTFYYRTVGRFAYINNLGKRISFTEYYAIVPDGSEKPSDLVFYNWLRVVDPRNEVPAIEATYNFQTNTTNTRLVVVNLKTGSLRNNFMIHPSAQEMYNDFNQPARTLIYQRRYLIDTIGRR